MIYAGVGFWVLEFKRMALDGNGIYLFLGGLAMEF